MTIVERINAIKRKLGFHVHKFDKWEVTHCEMFPWPNDHVVGYWQQRRCESCGKTQMKKVRS